MRFKGALPGVMRAAAYCWAMAMAMAVAMPSAVAAEPVQAPALRSGAVEWGISGALVSRGSTGATLSTRIGGLWAPWRGVSGTDTDTDTETDTRTDHGGPRQSSTGGLIGLELATVYSHVRELDSVDLLVSTSWSQPLGSPAFVPFIALTGGFRQEWLGSFHESRFPVGGALGFRALVGQRAAFRAEYLYLHLLDDVVGDRDEHQVLLGLSVFFRNE